MSEKKTKVGDLEINKKTANEAIRLSSKILKIIYKFFTNVIKMMFEVIKSLDT